MFQTSTNALKKKSDQLNNSMSKVTTPMRHCLISNCPNPPISASKSPAWQVLPESISMLFQNTTFANVYFAFGKQSAKIIANFLTALNQQLDHEGKNKTVESVRNMELIDNHSTNNMSLPCCWTRSSIMSTLEQTSCLSLASISSQQVALIYK